LALIYLGWILFCDICMSLYAFIKYEMNEFAWVMWFMDCESWTWINLDMRYQWNGWYQNGMVLVWSTIPYHGLGRMSWNGFNMEYECGFGYKGWHESYVHDK